ncbi:MAG TPA: GNAT family N-acetyltransferase [Acidimicrobiales bacterium]|nr:GNAT family N-acetyltransferase [Acidimicrobiales bacterium]
MIRLAALSGEPAIAAEALALVEEYLRLPDAWRGNPPEELPRWFRDELSNFPGDAAPPTGEVVVAFLDAAAAGVGLLRPLSGQIVEMKRVYVRASARRVGAGKAIVQRLIERARLLGYRELVLDVMPERRAAMQLYQSLGFTPIDAYRMYPSSDFRLNAFGIEL